MRARHFIPLISAIALALLPGLGQSEVYSWRDANGKIHYGDRMPGGTQSSPRRLQAAPISDDVDAAQKATAERQFAEREKQGKAQQDAAKKPAEDPAQAKAREDNCRQARANLASIESGQVRFSVNDKGERVALDGGVREAEIARARKSVDDWCSPPKTK